jgi:hypothetical protein
MDVSPRTFLDLENQYTSIKYTFMRHTPMRYAPMKMTPIRYTPILPTRWIGPLPYQKCSIEK